MRRCVRSAAAIVVASLLLAALWGSAIAAPAAAVSYSSDENEIVRLINKYRQANGLDALLVSDLCSDAAAKHSLDMATYDFFSHNTVRSDWFAPGATPRDRMIACGYPPPPFNGWGENIAVGWPTPGSALKAWKESDAHNRAMLDPRWTVMGVGFVYNASSDWGWYWTIDFGVLLDATAHPPGSSAPPDVTAPRLSFSTPPAGSNVSGTVTVEAMASDDLAVSIVELYVAGVKVGSDASSPFVFAWDTAGLDTGAYTLVARAFDAAGNMGSAQMLLHVTSTPGATTTTTAPPSTTTTTSPPGTTTTQPPSPTTTAPPSTTTTMVSPAGFADVRPSHPFYEAITSLAGLGIVSGSEGLFHPDALVTRAQFAKIIVLALGRHTPAIDRATDPTFPDVSYTGAVYPFDFVEEAVALDIVQGRKDGTFGPTANVTRAQLALMLVRAGGDGLREPPAGSFCPFIDLPGYARDAVAVAYYNGLVSGKTADKFGPYSNATRGQVAKMVYGLYQALTE